MPRVFISKRSATPCISSRSTIASSPRARTEICGNRDPATARGFDLASKLSPKLRRARTTRSSGQSPILARACWCSAALPIFRTIGMAWLASVYTICPLRDVWKWVVNGWSALGCRCARYLGHELGGNRTFRWSARDGSGLKSPSSVRACGAGSFTALLHSKL